MMRRKHFLNQTEKKRVKALKIKLLSVETVQAELWIRERINKIYLQAKERFYKKNKIS
ncbi:hypothetical protein [Bacillus sp. T33-2]|uniref:hypothetical protein n=1 Tax=Bacillus sp. T33-2 TaxID=2054168 RepID=UPI0015E122F3|nr:hypothetical protein [Bacillus sp. T33-2]